MVIAIVGTRKPTLSYEEWKTLVDVEIKSEDAILSGGAKGIDSYAKQLALDLNVRCIEYKPEYSKYGRPATFVRNQKIVDRADLILAFPSEESRGTYDTIRRAQKANKELKVTKI